MSSYQKFNQSTTSEGKEPYVQRGLDASCNRPIGTIFGTRMTCATVFCSFLRPIFYVAIVLVTHHYLTKYEPEQLHPKLLEYPWLVGIVNMIAIYALFWVFFEYVLGMKHIGTFDNIYLHDTAKNKPIITAVMYFDKFDHTMLDYMKERMLKYRRLRSGFVQFLDCYYLKELSEPRLEQEIEKAYVRVDKNYLGEQI